MKFNYRELLLCVLAASGQVSILESAETLSLGFSSQSLSGNLDLSTNATVGRQIIEERPPLPIHYGASAIRVNEALRDALKLDPLIDIVVNYCQEPPTVVVVTKDQVASGKIPVECKWLMPFCCAKCPFWVCERPDIIIDYLGKISLRVMLVLCIKRRTEDYLKTGQYDDHHQRKHKNEIVEVRLSIPDGRLQEMKVQYSSVHGARTAEYAHTDTEIFKEITYFRGLLNSDKRQRFARAWIGIFPYIFDGTDDPPTNDQMRCDFQMLDEPTPGCGFKASIYKYCNGQLLASAVSFARIKSCTKAPAAPASFTTMPPSSSSSSSSLRSSSSKSQN